MDLVIAHPFLHQRGGAERCVLELAKKFNPVIYCTKYVPDSTFPEFKEFDIRLLPSSKLEAPLFFLRGDARRSGGVAAGLRYYTAKLKDDYDVINAQGTPSEWIRNKNERVVWYCHSPNREAFDLYDFRMKELSPPKRVLNAALLSGYRFLEFRTVPRIEKILTNSEVSKGRITQFLHRPDAEVVHPGVDVEKFHNAGYLKYFLCPSRIVPEKRFEYCIDAFREFCRTHPSKGWKLVIAGFLAPKPREQQYLKMLKGRAAGLPVEFKLDLSDSQLISLYAHCYAVLFSAINEDFGLVPPEAGASSKPCISVDEGGPRYTILEGKTGFLVHSPEEMAERMGQLAGDAGFNERLGKAGRKRAVENYSWKQYVQKVGQALKTVAAGKNEP